MRKDYSGHVTGQKSSLLLSLFKSYILNYNIERILLSLKTNRLLGFSFVLYILLCFYGR